MRRAVFGLLAVAGCNQFWGLDPSVLSGSELPQVQLSLEISYPDEAGAPGFVEYNDIPGAEGIRVGTIGGELQSVLYLPGQHLGVPEEVFTATPRWRLVYPVIDESLPEAERSVMREVQWRPAENPSAHLVHSHFAHVDAEGKLDPRPVPPGSGYQISATTNVPATRESVGLYTTGSWTAYRATRSSRLVDHFLTSSSSLSGPLQAPVQARNDLAVYVDYTTNYMSPSTPAFEYGCRYAIGTMSFITPDLVDGSLTPVSAPYSEFPASPISVTTEEPCIPCDLGNLLGTRASIDTPQRPRQRTRWEYGYVPAFTFAFSKPGGLDGDPFLLPRPRIIPLAECTFPRDGAAVHSTPLAFFDVKALLDLRFPRVVHYEVVDTRFTAGGAALSSGYSVVAIVATSSAHIQTLVPAAVEPIELRRGDTAVAQLAGPSDGVTVERSGDRLELVFGVQERAGYHADYFDITMYSIDGSQLKRERIYTIVDRTPSVTIDPADLRANTEYVFGITSYRGFPVAARGDFSLNAFPQSSVTIFTRTFKTE